MGGFSPWHLLVIAIVAAVLFFGWKQLPDMARSVGRSLRVFKTEIKGMTDDDKARDEARDAANEAKAEPRELEAGERPTSRADVVPNPAALRKTTDEPARERPRPAPSPHGRAG